MTTSAQEVLDRFLPEVQRAARSVFGALDDATEIVWAYEPQNDAWPPRGQSTGRDARSAPRE